MNQPDPYEEFRRAEIFFNAGQPAEACRILEPVLEAAPESTASLELLARAQFASAQLGPAERSLRELVSRRPDDAWAHIALARTLERLGRREEAEPHRRLATALGQTED
jgi:Flp pilus assembly protein TadD